LALTILKIVKETVGSSLEQSFLIFFKGHPQIGNLPVTLPRSVVGIGLGHFEIGTGTLLRAFWSSTKWMSVEVTVTKSLESCFRSTWFMLVSFIGGYLKLETWFLPYFRDIDPCYWRLFGLWGLGPSSLVFRDCLALVVEFRHDSRMEILCEYALLVGVGGLCICCCNTFGYSIIQSADWRTFWWTFALTAEISWNPVGIGWSTADRMNLQSKLIRNTK